MFTTTGIPSIRCTTAKVRGSWNFGFWVEFKIFLISGRKRGGGVLFLRVKSVHFLSIFSFWNAQDFKNSKLFVCSALIFNIPIFRFKMDAGLQVDFEFNTKSKFFCSRSSFFSLLSGHSKPTKPMRLLFYPFGRFRGRSKPSSQ